jgi:hypothetical protein
MINYDQMLDECRHPLGNACSISDKYSILDNTLLQYLSTSSSVLLVLKYILFPPMLKGTGGNNIALSPGLY